MKSAEIAGKSLNSRAHGKEIVIRAQIVNLVFDERFLKRRRARRGASCRRARRRSRFRVRARPDNSRSRRASPGFANRPDETKCLREKGQRKSGMSGSSANCSPLPKKSLLPGRAELMLLVAGTRRSSTRSVRCRRDVQECLLAENRHVALQPVAIERVPPVACRARTDIRRCGRSDSTRASRRSSGPASRGTLPALAAEFPA